MFGSILYIPLSYGSGKKRDRSKPYNIQLRMITITGPSEWFYRGDLKVKKKLETITSFVDFRL